MVLTPAHQFPTGVVLSPARRRALLDWAAAAGGLVIEDDYDAEHRYDRAPVAALQASAPDRVAYTGSTSKSLAPGMRLGWLIAPHRMQPDLLAAKHASDLGNPALPQLVLAHLLAAATTSGTCATCAPGSAAAATRCSPGCASTCRRPGSRASRPGCTC